MYFKTYKLFITIMSFMSAFLNATFHDYSFISTGGSPSKLTYFLGIIIIILKENFLFNTHLKRIESQLSHNSKLTLFHQLFLS